MPAKSKRQYRFMKMIEHAKPETIRNKPKGLSKKEAREYTKSNVGKKKYSKLVERVKSKKKS